MPRVKKTVGITATSHKVIRNLLDKVVEIGEVTGVDVRCVQKPKKGTVRKAEDQHPKILETDKDAVILGGIAA